MLVRDVKRRLGCQELLLAAAVVQAEAPDLGVAGDALHGAALGTGRAVARLMADAAGVHDLGAVSHAYLITARQARVGAAESPLARLIESLQKTKAHLFQGSDVE